MKERAIENLLKDVLPSASSALVEDLCQLAECTARVSKAPRIEMIEQFIALHDLPGSIDWLEFLIGLAHIHRGLCIDDD